MYIFIHIETQQQKGIHPLEKKGTSECVSSCNAYLDYPQRQSRQETSPSSRAHCPFLGRGDNSPAQVTYRACAFFIPSATLSLLWSTQKPTNQPTKPFFPAARLSGTCRRCVGMSQETIATFCPAQ